MLCLVWGVIVCTEKGAARTSQRADEPARAQKSERLCAVGELAVTEDVWVCAGMAVWSAVSLEGEIYL